MFHSDNSLPSSTVVNVDGELDCSGPHIPLTYRGNFSIHSHAVSLALGKIFTMNVFKS